ncbi:MAG: YbhB/YbcL family Raf kinase inhibitor-like protein [Nocardioides sp.]
MGVPVGLTGVLVTCALLTSCGGGERPQVDVAPDVPESVRVTSPAFSDGDRLPTRFTCDGDGSTPPLTWRGGPGGPGSWAVVVEDPDAPGGAFVHWVVLDVPPGVRELPGGALPDGAVQARTSGGGPGYTPACPPDGEHRYRFIVYALAEPTGLTGDVGLDEALAAVTERATARGVLVATYSRP